jgi:hypothetical protein
MYLTKAEILPICQLALTIAQKVFHLLNIEANFANENYQELIDETPNHITRQPFGNRAIHLRLPL